MLKFTPALILTLSLFAPAASLAQPLDPAEQFQIQATEPECPADLAGCPVRGDYFTWRDRPIPYTLSPRRSKILTPQPVLRWLPVEGATSYTVILEGPGIDWQVDNITATEIQYSGDVPLQPGDWYQFFVEADTGAVSWDEPAHSGGVGFAVLTPAEEAAIATALTELQGALADQYIPQHKADLYIEAGLITPGITLLEDLWQEDPSPELAVRLGNLYFGWLLLVEPSEVYYQAAVEQTEAAPTLARAIALEQLGHLAAVKQDFEGAIAFWQQAQSVYRAVGEAQAATDLDEEIQQF
jgi:hypothetical protein